MSRRHEPLPPGQPEPGEMPIEPDQGSLPAVPSPEEDGGEDQRTTAPA